MLSQKTLLSTLNRFPLTVALAFVALAASASPFLTSALELNFAAVAEGQWWRLLTGHLTHFDSNHLLWDLLMFCGLGAACELRFRKRYWVLLPMMALSIAVGIRLFCEGIDVYRGLSGIDTGLFVWIAGDQVRRAWFGRDHVVTILWLVPCMGLICKLLYEAFTGQCLFVDADGFQPVVEAHIAGVLLGATAAICFRGSVNGDAGSAIRATTSTPSRSFGNA